MISAMSPLRKCAPSHRAPTLIPVRVCVPASPDASTTELPRRELLAPLKYPSMSIGTLVPADVPSRTAPPNIATLGAALIWIVARVVDDRPSTNCCAAPPASPMTIHVKGCDYDGVVSSDERSEG